VKRGIEGGKTFYEKVLQSILDQGEALDGPTSPSQNLSYHLSQLEDPRMDRRKEHSLHDVLMISILAMLCGAETFVDFEDFGKAKEEWLREFLELPGGIPSHDTFGRVFSLMDQEAFAESFRNWTEGLRRKVCGEIVAIDGKTLRRSLDRLSGKSAIHMVSAWGRENGLVLGQVKVDEKEFARAVRGHWSVENSLHWCLDVCFGEDQCRARIGNASENLAILRHVTLNILKRDASKKRGIKGKQKNASWDHSCLIKLLDF
jgi:predicted transposase YbfD/YdcC